VVLKLGHSDKWIVNTRIFKCGAGKQWRRSIGPIIVRNEEVLHGVKEQRNILQIIK